MSMFRKKPVVIEAAHKNGRQMYEAGYNQGREDMGRETWEVVQQKFGRN